MKLIHFSNLGQWQDAISKYYAKNKKVKLRKPKYSHYENERDVYLNGIIIGHYSPENDNGFLYIP